MMAQTRTRKMPKEALLPRTYQVNAVRRSCILGLSVAFVSVTKFCPYYQTIATKQKVSVILSVVYEEKHYLPTRARIELCERYRFPKWKNLKPLLTSSNLPLSSCIGCTPWSWDMLSIVPKRCRRRIPSRCRSLHFEFFEVRL